MTDLKWTWTYRVRHNREQDQYEVLERSWLRGVPADRETVLGTFADQTEAVRYGWWMRGWELEEIDAGLAEAPNG